QIQKVRLRPTVFSPKLDFHGFPLTISSSPQSSPFAACLPRVAILVTASQFTSATSTPVLTSFRRTYPPSRTLFPPPLLLPKLLLSRHWQYDRLNFSLFVHFVSAGLKLSLHFVANFSS
ncbi:unnamed protein product, partial [Linum tenue]